jgi:hypothetical protein
MDVRISYGMVPARAASSSTRISSSPWRPMRTTSSPLYAEPSPSSTIIASIVMFPIWRLRAPPMRTSARFDSARR